MQNMFSKVDCIKREAEYSKF